MRLHQPRSTVEALERFLSEPAVAATVTARRILPAREAVTTPLPGWLCSSAAQTIRAVPSATP